MGLRFTWLWAAYGSSVAGTWLAFDAFPLIAVLVLGAGPAQVSLLAAAGLAVGALIAVPLGPRVEFRRKLPVMVGADLLRFAALLTIPLAHWLGVLGFWHLLAVAVLVATADITFQAASGAYLKGLLPAADLLPASARLESTAWTATIVGPPAGGALVGVFGPLVTVLLNAASFLASALCLRGARGPEPVPVRVTAPRAADLVAGWRHLLGDPVLRPLLLNTALVNGLVLATSPLMAVLLLGDLGFPAWQHGLVFGLPCLGGLIGSRCSAPLAGRFGERRVLRASGAARACWPVLLPLVHPGPTGLLLVLVAQSGLLLSIGVFTPLLAAHRLRLIPADRTARALTAWTITVRATTAAATALGGVLAGVVGTRAGLLVIGGALLLTPVLLPRREEG
ncbi:MULTISPECIES: MFS transporter [Actinosynnema]|uniref:MFS transporter n=1 Tax=Actinosynnema TaxID=40566 RepID=UPI0020A39FA2|nr:MFS transporter [Actinosynnema pretiosum]MCP2099447.1 MFS-type transporter involved in bile tolerance, Atg22 family [Actinosynnema pretiosum]